MKINFLVEQSFPNPSKSFHKVEEGGSADQGSLQVVFLANNFYTGPADEVACVLSTFLHADSRLSDRRFALVSGVHHLPPNLWNSFVASSKRGWE